MSVLDTWLSRRSAQSASVADQESLRVPSDFDFHRSLDLSRSTDRPLKLLLLNYEFPPLGGGAGSATYYMSRELHRRGHRVDVLTAQGPGGESFQSLDGVRVFKVPSYRLGVHDAGIRGAASFLFFARIKLPQLMQENNYDLLHYYFGLPTGILSSYSHGKRNVPYIVSLRGSDVPGYDHDSAPTIHRLLGSTRHRIWHNAAAVVANSGSLRDLALHSEPDCHIEVIPNGVCTRRFAARLKTRNQEKALRILCVSRLVERKGLDTLIRAVAELRDLDLTLNIIGTGKLEAQLKSLAGSLGLEERVCFSGFVEQADLPEHHRRADVFVLPSHSESCAMALLEAMSSGLPIITSNVGGNAELVHHNENGLLFKPGSVGDLSAALRTLTESPALRERFVLANVKKIEAQHAWRQIASRYENVYRRVLSADPVRGKATFKLHNFSSESAVGSAPQSHLTKNI